MKQGLTNIETENELYIGNSGKARNTTNTTVTVTKETRLKTQ